MKNIQPKCRFVEIFRVIPFNFADTINTKDLRQNVCKQTPYGVFIIKLYRFY